MQSSAEDFSHKVMAGRATINLSVGEGRILKFDGPVESVFIVDTAIVDMRIASRDVVYIYSKKNGMTNLVAASAKQRVCVTVQIRIATNSLPENDPPRKLKPTTTTEITFSGELPPRVPIKQRFADTNKYPRVRPSGSCAYGKRLRPHAMNLLPPSRSSVPVRQL